VNHFFTYVIQHILRPPLSSLNPHQPHLHPHQLQMSLMVESIPSPFVVVSLFSYNIAVVGALEACGRQSQDHSSFLQTMTQGWDSPFHKDPQFPVAEELQPQIAALQLVTRCDVVHGLLSKVAVVF